MSNQRIPVTLSARPADEMDACKLDHECEALAVALGELVDAIGTPDANKAIERHRAALLITLAPEKLAALHRAQAKLAAYRAAHPVQSSTL